MLITDPTQINEYYTALLQRDAAYLDTFVVGVTTTEVFCLPTCRARKPKRSNVLFYTDSKEATAAGFRP